MGGDIAQVGSSCCNSFTVASGHRRCSTPHLAPIDSFMGDRHQCSVITAGHARAGHLTPSMPTRQAVSNVTLPFCQFGLIDPGRWGAESILSRLTEPWSGWSQW